MQKSILVFSNGEKIGDGLIKLPLLYEIKRRLPDYKLIWMTNLGATVYNNQLKNIAGEFIDEIYEQANLSVFFWKKISDKYELNKSNFEYILDTQKAVIRTLALKRIQCSNFISSCAGGIFSSKKIHNKVINKKRNYYLEDLFDLLNLIKAESIDKNFKLPIPNALENQLKGIFNKNKLYLGIAPGAGEQNKIWPLENFLKVGEFFEKKSYNLVFFLGPQEKFLKDKILKTFPNTIFPEEIITEFSGPEIVMGATKFLSCALSNDSGVSHMLSTNYCPLVKLFGPKDSDKFTPINSNIFTINSKEFGSKNIKLIETKFVIKKINEIIG